MATPLDAVHNPAKWFKHEYSVCAATLRRWHLAGKVSAIRYPGGKRVYNVQAVRALLNDQHRVAGARALLVALCARQRCQYLCRESSGGCM